MLWIRRAAELPCEAVSFQGGYSPAVPGQQYFPPNCFILPELAAFPAGPPAETTRKF